MLRDAAVRWFKSTCPGRKVHQDLISKLDEAIRRGVNCSFAVGEAMARDLRPYLLHWYSGELFIFQLSRRQAAGLGVSPKSTVSCLGRQRARERQLSAPAISLEGIELSPPVLSAVDQTITIKCSYRAQEPIFEPFALRMDFTRTGNSKVVAYSYPFPTLATQGTLEGQFKLAATTQVEPVQAVFVRCCTVPKSGVSDGEALSNPVAAILEINSGHAGFRGSPRRVAGPPHEVGSGTAPTWTPTPRGFKGNVAFISPDGELHPVLRPDPLDWDSTPLRADFQRLLLAHPAGFRHRFSLPPLTNLDVQWARTSETEGIGVWARHGAVWAVSLMLRGAEIEHALPAMRQQILSRKLPLSPNAWQAILEDRNRPLLALLHFDIRSIGDPTIVMAAPVLAAVFFGSFSAG